MSTITYYRTKDRRHDFKFRFVWQGDYFEIYCLQHPALNGRDPDPHKTHLFTSGKVCFVAGMEPRDEDRAEELAAQWSEYILEYIRTGIAQQ